jgi:hypothetical protein
VALKGLPVEAPWGHLGDLSACVAILEIRSPYIYGFNMCTVGKPFLPLPASKPAMVALTEFRGRKTSPCKGAKLGETGSSMVSLGNLEGGVRSPLGGRFCCGPAMHRWREPLASPLQVPLDDDCEGEECEMEPIPSYRDLQSSFGTIRRYMESHLCDVSKYVGLLLQIEKYLQVVHADESHQRTIDSYFTRDL